MHQQWVAQENQFCNVCNRPVPVDDKGVVGAHPVDAGGVVCIYCLMRAAAEGDHFAEKYITDRAGFGNVRGHFCEEKYCMGNPTHTIRCRVPASLSKSVGRAEVCGACALKYDGRKMYPEIEDNYSKVRKAVQRPQWYNWG